MKIITKIWQLVIIMAFVLPILKMFGIITISWFWALFLLGFNTFMAILTIIVWIILHRNIEREYDDYIDADDDIIDYLENFSKNR